MHATKFRLNSTTVRQATASYAHNPNGSMATMLLMLLAIILMIACKDSDKKLSSVEKLNCDEWRDAEWVNSFCQIYENDTLKYYIASIYALLSNPNFFDKKLVRTCGYLSADIAIETLRAEYILYPSEKDILYYISSNTLKIRTVKNEDEILKQMEVPFENIYICLDGLFSKQIAYHRSMSYGFINAEVDIIHNIHKRRQNFKNEEYQELRMLNEKLDSLMKEGKDSLEIHIAPLREFFQCPSFKIEKGRIRSANLRNCRKER